MAQCQCDYVEGLKELASDAKNVQGRAPTLLQLAEQGKTCQLALMGFGAVLQARKILNDGNVVLGMSALELVKCINSLKPST